jgi:hypothetical protein
MCIGIVGIFIENAKYINNQRINSLSKLIWHFVKTLKLVVPIS